MIKYIAVLALLIATCVQAQPVQKCGIDTKVCTAPNETRNIDGQQVHRDCWAWAVTYACVQPAVSDTCESAVSRGGVLTNTTCSDGITIDGGFECINEDREYTITTRPAGSSSTLDCSGRKYCLNGNCFDVGSAPNQDFRKAVAGMETLREAGAYLDESTLELFKGQDNRCGKNAVLNCCKTSGSPISGLTNLAVMGGSPYTFDVLGVGSGRSAVHGLGFDPTEFALSTAHGVVTEMLKCDKDETLLAIKRNKRLCHHVGDYCSRRIRLGFTRVCVQKKETHCCFNSKISRLINEAAREKIPGMGWGSAEAPSCNGLTIDQFQSLDLSTIDFSEMYEDIVPKMPDGAAVANENAAAKECYFTEGCTPPQGSGSCQTPWGANVTDGAFVTAYREASVPSNRSCESELRVCRRGALSGSFASATCSRRCRFYEPCGVR